MSAFIPEVKSWQSIGGIPLNNGKIYVGIVGLDPVLNPEAIFSDRDLTIPLANPVDIDAFGNPVSKIWVAGRYSLQIDDVSGSQVFLELDNGQAPGIQSQELTNVQGFNAITADAIPPITILIDKSQFIFQIIAENTIDAVTLGVGTTGAKSIKRNFDQDVGKGKFKVGQTVIVAYNSGEDVYEWINENARVRFNTKGVDIAAAATVNLSLATGNFIDITGDGGGVAVSSFGTVLTGVRFSCRFPGTTPVSITSSSVANPTNILTATAHGISNGADVVIVGHSGATPNLNTDTDEDGRYVNTNVDTTNFTIPVNVTVGGTGGTVYGIPKITNGANIICPGGLDIELRTNDIIDLISLGSGIFFVEDIKRTDGGPPLIASNAQAVAGLDNFLAMSARRVRDLLDVPRTEIFINSGTYTVSSQRVFITAVGSGGGGEAGSNAVFGGAGGAAGGWIEAEVDVSGEGGSVTITIGAAGIGGTSAGADGTAGANVTFGSLVTANGGGGGTASGATGGTGGTSSTTGVNLVRSNGNPGLAETGSFTGGDGGGSPRSNLFAIGISGGVGVQGPNRGDGGAGGGGSAGSFNGGDGRQGYILVTPIIEV